MKLSERIYLTLLAKALDPSDTDEARREKAGFCAEEALRLSRLFYAIEGGRA